MADKSDQIVTPYARLSFAQLVKPRAFDEGDTPKYGASFIFPKPDHVEDVRSDEAPLSPWKDASKHDLDPIRKQLDEYVKTTWPKGAPKNLRLPIRDGDEKEWDGYGGCFFIRASSIYPPTLVDARKEKVEKDRAEQVFYSGCWVRAILAPFSYNTRGNVGVSVGLRAVQFVRDDTPFTGGGASPDDFSDLPEDDIAPADLDDLE